MLLLYDHSIIVYEHKIQRMNEVHGARRVTELTLSINNKIINVILRCTSNVNPLNKTTNKQQQPQQGGGGGGY
jgi:hypothetical protein